MYELHTSISNFIGHMDRILDMETICAYNRKHESLTIGLSECLKKHTRSLFLSPYKNGIYLKCFKGNAGVAVARYPALFLSPDGDNLLQGKCSFNAYKVCLRADLYLSDVSPFSKLSSSVSTYIFIIYAIMRIVKYPAFHRRLFFSP